MGKSKMTKRQPGICVRLRQARERLGLTQNECARRIGIERTRFVNYEIGRTPLRWDVALRFCRQLIVSEEWLATGRFDACHKAALINGFSREANLHNLDDFFFRQCVDLLSEPAALHLPLGAPFVGIYEQVFAAKYLDLVTRCFHVPRIRFTDSDGRDLIVEWNRVVFTRFCEKHAS